MFELKTVLLNKKISNEKEITLLFDIDSCCPCLYPLLFSMKILRFQSPSTQRSDLIALKFWYKFWFDKYSTSFCESFYSSSYNFEMIQNEIDNFIIYLESNNELNNIILLRNNINISYETISNRIRSFFKFYNFLLTEYLTIQTHPHLTKKEIEKIKLNIENYIRLKKKIINKFSKSSKTIKGELNYFYKSMTDEMVVNLYRVISPSKSNFNNDLNPFKIKDAQFRNFLIVHFMLNYGLRVGELMLLTVNSIKKSIQSNSYNLIVTSTDDEFDDRKRRPRIKNEYSYRVIKLQERDYKFLKTYISKIRKEISSEILFTSLKPPYSPLSYSSINKIFDKIDFVLKENNPEYFEEKNYDSIERITPHVCRHTWAYMMLSYSFKKYKNEDKLHPQIGNVIQGALDKAQEDLRVIGGWSPTSVMPIHYGKRFIVERANLSNLARIVDTSINFE